MTTAEVANKLVALCREGKHLEAVETLYDDNIVSREMPGYPNEITEGIKAVHQKSEDFFSSVAEWHGGDLSDPVIAGNHFTTKSTMDATFKDGNRVKMEEIAVYEVKDGKIIKEQFFYSM
ncbi:MAG: nuclear transport factor 2 family protein [Flavobacteriaceae bacterium]